MHVPTISQYSASISNPKGLFRTLGEPECERNAYGEPVFTAGGNSVVFKIRTGGRSWGLKCYTRPDVSRMKRICSYFSRRRFPLVYPIHYLPQEIYVYDTVGRGAWYDVTVSEWAEGSTLDYEIRKGLHYRDRERLAALAVSFDRMASELLSMPWAHGDLKPLNIIVTPAGEMKLIDYDCIYYPGPDEHPAMENGTPQYCHPGRSTRRPGKFLDDYPAAFISSTLHSLAMIPSASSRFGTADTFLFDPEEILEGKSRAYEYIKDASAREGDARLYALLSSLSSVSPELPELKAVLDFHAHKSLQVSSIHHVPEPFRHNGKWGYCREGETIIPPLFDSALEFSEGLAAVFLDRYPHFIDPTGRTVINCSGYETAKSFSEGLAAVKRGGRWGYIDQYGKEVAECVLSSASSFRGGVAMVTTGQDSRSLIQRETLHLSVPAERSAPILAGRSRETEKGAENIMSPTGYIPHPA